MKRVTFLLTFVFLLAFQPLLAFADDIKGHTLEQEMRALAEEEIMQGYSNGKFGPDDPVTRGQFTLLIYRALSLPDPGGNISFEDVELETELERAVRSAHAADIINGYTETEFRPNVRITREQMAAMIYRALQFEKIEGVKVPLQFTDNNLVNDRFKDDVAFNTYFGIIRGIPVDNKGFRFAPTETATRAHAAAFIFRMLKVVENDGQPYNVFQIGTIAKGGVINYDHEQYFSFLEAKEAYDASKHDVIAINSQIVKMNDGMAITRPAQGATVTIYNAALSDSLTYLPANIEMKYLEADGTRVKVQIAGTVGYVLAQDVSLTPTPLLDGRSYYANVDGILHHYIYLPNSNRYETPYTIGPAPDFMKTGQRYYSWGGNQFYDSTGELVGEHYSYFNYLPLRTKTTYTAEDLNRVVRELRPNSPLDELGEIFIEMQEEYNINALYLLGKAVHESAWGLSTIAQEKKNLFGYKAVDSDPLNGAEDYETFEDSVRDIAAFLHNSYLSSHNPSTSNLTRNWRYNGALLGNKTAGVNVRYASDPYWGQKIAGHMFRMDHHLGGYDLKEESEIMIGIVNTAGGLNVRTAPTTQSAAQYSYPRLTGFSVQIVGEEVDALGDTWYKIISDHPSHEFGYVYGHGSLGEYIKLR